jgi:hypothetical protein
VSTNSQRGMQRREIADFLTEQGYRIAPSTLAKLAVIGGGPAFRKFGSRPIYDPDESLEWARSRTTSRRTSTSDNGARDE